MKTNVYVYVGQDHCFWRLSADEWEQVCRDGIRGGYDLTVFKQLAGKPIWLKRHPKTAGGNGYYRTRTDMLYYEPLEWDVADFKEALEELEQKRQSIGDV